MNRDFTPQSQPSRSLFVCAALLVSLTIIGSIDQLSRHYGDEAQLAVSTKPVTVAANAR